MTMINNGFNDKFFSSNRARLKELLPGKALIVLAANGLLQRGGDTSYPFCQDASFWYLTGCNEPDVVLVCDEDKEYLVVPQREGNRVAFDGEINEVILRETSGIQTILGQEQGWKWLKKRLLTAKQVATLAAPPDYIKPLGMFANPARERLLDELKSSNPRLKIHDISQNIARLRVIKQPIEVRAIQTAVDITSAALVNAFQLARQGKLGYEYEIEAELSRDFRRKGADGHAFEPIIAAGKNACTLHNIQNDGPLSSDELLLCDVGAEYNHYAADITRTVSLSRPTKRQEAVHNAVLDAQIYALSVLRPGIFLKEYERQVQNFLGQKLQELGLVKAITRQSVRKFTPHSISHFLGLNAHDVGQYDQPLEPGMVITVEPGIYINEESIGIRIEDDVLITPNGTKVLSSALSRSLV